VGIQLPLDAPRVPGRGGEHEDIPSQQILWLRFLGHLFLDIPCGDNTLQRVDQRIHHVLRVAAGRGKDNMEGPTPDEIRNIPDGIGGLVRELRVWVIDFRHRVVFQPWNARWL